MGVQEYLREYQDICAEAIANNGRGIIGDDMGLGKTLTAMGALEKAGYVYGRNLIIARSNAQATWMKEIDKWLPDDVELNFITGHYTERKRVWDYAKKNGGYYLVTSNTLVRDIEKGYVPKYWDAVVDDEYHRHLRSRSSKTLRALRTLRWKMFIFLSGSSVSKGPQDLWPPLYILMPKSFSSYWRFVYNYCQVIEGPFGKEIEGPKNAHQLKKDLGELWWVRKKKDVLPELPPKTRQFVDIELTKEQRKFYDQLKKHMLAELPDDDIMITANSLEQLTRLRQLLVCPKILNESFGYGAAIEAIGDQLNDTDDRHCAIFTPFTKAIPYIRQYLVDEMGFDDDSVVTLKGGLKPQEVNDAIQTFRERRGIAICSILFSESFELTPATYGFFLGADYDPENNLQAEDRLHRMNITEAVNLYYMRFPRTIDDDVMDILDDKVNSTRKLIKRAATDTKARPTALDIKRLLSSAP